MINRREDVIYGRKHGMALTLDVFTPQQNANGIGLVLPLSAAWVASHEAIENYVTRFIEPLVDRGYSVFVVVPSSRPRFTIPEMIQDVQRAVRFIRHRAPEFAIDPDRIGCYSLSAGGHLALMLSLTGGPGDADADDPVDRESSRIQALGEFYGPSDFLNYGEAGANALGHALLVDCKAAFDFCELDPQTQAYIPVTDAQAVLEIGRQISPVTHVRADAPPTLIIHGDSDPRVPFQQSQVLAKKMEKAGATVKLVVVPGEGHSWPDMNGEMKLIGDWFDAHLKASGK